MNLPKPYSDYIQAIKTANQAGLSLSVAIRSVLTARFHYNIGPLFHSIFELWNKPNDSWAEYIGSYEVNERHRPLSDESSRHLTNDKVLFFGHCKQYGLPTIPILCTIDRKATAGDSELINCIDIEKWRETLKSAPSRIFIKPIDGIHGTGAFSASRDGEYWRFNGHFGSATDLHNYCVRTIQGKRGWLIQPVIEPHHEMRDRLSPNALATIRVVTCMNGNEPKIMFAVLRIPVGDSATDNWSLGLTGNLVAPIALDSGELGIGRTSCSRVWPVMTATEKHPDTGKSIFGYALPYWEASKKLALNGQLSLPQVPTMGWDIALTESGPIIVETNWGYAVELIEVALQRGIRSDLAPTFAPQ